MMVEEPQDLIGAVEDTMKRHHMSRPLDAAPRMVGLIRELLREYAEDLER